MTRLLRAATRWIAAHAVLFVAIVVVLALSHLKLRPLVDDYRALRNEIARLEFLAQTFPSTANGAIGEIRSHWPKPQERSPASLRGKSDSLMKHKESLLRQREHIKQQYPFSYWIPGTDAWERLALVDLELQSIETLLGALADLQTLTANAERMEDEIATLSQSKEQRDRLIDERKNQRTGIQLRIDGEPGSTKGLIAQCKQTASEIAANTRRMQQIAGAHPMRARLPRTEPYESYNDLEKINSTLQQFFSDDDCHRRIQREQDLRNSFRIIERSIQDLESRNQTLSESLSRAQQSLTDARNAIAAEPHLSAAAALRDEQAAAIRERLRSLEQIFDSNPYFRFISLFETCYQQALWILAAVIMAPYLCALLAYYACAGVVSNRFPLRLDRRKSLTDSPFTNAEPGSRLSVTSGRSIPVEITPQHVLIVRPEFRESSPADARVSTVWIYDWLRPFTSIASGLALMTRFESKESAVVSLVSTSDPHAKLAAIPLAEGESLVVRPRSVIGIVQDPSNPLRVRTMWKPWSLACWLRFQIRFVVLSGPGQIIIQGRNGVVAERADSGRTVSQAATIAYSPHLSYSVVRCETFAGYVTGARALFNDRFRGPGICVYEAAPRISSLRHGPTRFIQDVADSLLRAVGI